MLKKSSNQWVVFSIVRMLLLIAGVIAIAESVAAEDFSGGEPNAINRVGSISGFVKPMEAGVTIIAIQNLSYAAETITDNNGHYTLENLKSGSYGLLFIRNGTVYVYNDEIHKNIDRNKPLIVQIKEPVTLGTTDANINLNTELADYFANRFTVQFKPEVSEEKINELISYYNSSIKEKISWSWGSISYVLIAPDKTLLQTVRDFASNENVESAELVGISYLGESDETNTYATDSNNETLLKNISKNEEEPKMVEYPSISEGSNGLRSRRFLIFAVSAIILIIISAAIYFRKKIKNDEQ
ncbi:MAG: hypothetical protein V1702_02240 [Candidatus Woesearchaeota archaeon]